MSLSPVFELGLWNAWILWIILFLSTLIPEFFWSKEAKTRKKRATGFIPFKKKTDKILALSTHVVIMPFSMIYSIFLPLKLGSAWFYAGLVIFTVSLVMNFMTTLGFATTPLDKPVTGGIYRVSRHPVYFSGFLLFIGMGIASASWIMLLCGVLWFILFHMVIPAEEQFLLEKYGDLYREYMDKTPRWIGLPKPGKNR